MCEYILDTGTRRPCPAGKGCFAHTKLRKKAVRKRRQDICVSTRPEVYQKHKEQKKPGRQPMIDFTALRQMWLAKMTDKDMALLLGCSVPTVKEWRKRLGYTKNIKH